MKRIVLALLTAVFAPILLATQCDGDPEFYTPQPKLYVQNTQNLHVNDTVWVNYLVSSNMYSSQKHDSIANVNPGELRLFLIKLQPQQNGYNAATTSAYVKIVELGTNDAAQCPEDPENSIYHPFFSFQEKLYRIKVGFKMLEAGDFAVPLHFDNVLKTDPQNQIAADYLLDSGFDLSYSLPCSGAIEVNLEDYPGNSHAFFHVSP